MQAPEAATWRPAASVATSQCRARLSRLARDFFRDRNILEVDTPALGATTVTDPNIDSLIGRDESWYLQTSPEYFMKRLLAAGYPDIYQICKVFRDGESGRNHRAEFTLVEWYRLNFQLNEMMQETTQFIASLLERTSLDSSVIYMTFAEAFEAAVGIEPFSCSVESLADCAAVDAGLRASLGDDRDAWLNLLVSGQVANSFSKSNLTVIYHYPASQAALARLCPANAGVADRFEVYYGALELANGFVELVDAEEQLARFSKDIDSRRRQDKAVLRIDENFIAALRHGLPPCAGVAVGFERLLMLKENSNNIRNVNTFPDELMQ